MYKRLDVILKNINIRIYKAFENYRKLPFDELNTFTRIKDLYEELDKINRKYFWDIATYYYYYEDGKLSKAKLDEILRTPSKVMKFSYNSELLRKRDRLIEALLATSGSVAEFDKAMRYWVQMTAWFGVEVADAAMAQARDDKGVDRVMWVSEHDEKVCSVCRSLDNVIFNVDALPPKPHPNCRCYAVEV